jgi:hypothetical protein
VAEPEPICIEIASPAVSGPVLSRVTAFLAARAGLSVDRVSDALLVADTISSAHVFLQDEPLRVAVITRDGALELTLGPLEAGAAERILGAPHIDGHGILDRLVDQRVILPDSEGRERLRLVLGRTDSGLD